MKLKEVIKPYSQNPEALENISATTDFTNDLKINSANLVDVFLDVEEAFEIELENSSLEKIANVYDAIDVIELKLQEKNQA
ncbi:phosphopantetheine-binding protein [Flavobacterium tegetincola]|uniref:phosphopantetheine-binding protein n=1 Tax=Flavobacterium tegetincola TaxID=150172 RepID=UPI00040F260F|nr:phosphopantetheine-binding protein [Flavobacterium tegetincola]